ncbi:M56 family metallopeptidase [Emticicia agri]|uniref:Peptidase M56 domain-containing protein n=1 Tax=Emticicia agri TaxID=2492393 RepID=A0A4V1ZCX0_9BACT|nr:M56 family metallopeptidase [Emticicia agri]RYU94130.1 hypothetical protein EWM59_18310 [Emticicia agri]
MLFLIYLLKVSACLAVFYGLYFFAFRKFTFHTLNRFYLLSTLCVGFLIPLISFETTKVVKATPVTIVENIPLASAPVYSPAYAPDYDSQKIATVKPEKKTDWRFYILSGYIMVAMVLLLFFCTKLFKIYQLSRKAVKAANLRIVQSDGQLTNASFFNLIFLNTNGLSANEKAQIIAHECVHVRQLHSIDVLLVELCKIALWFNPIIYFYKKSLIEIHEFEADLNTIQQFDSKNYAQLLLKLGINHQVDLTNQFSLRPLSTRIQFIFRKRTGGVKKVFYMLGLPLLALGIFSFAQRHEKLIYKATNKAAEKINSKIERLTEELQSTESDTILTQPEIKPLASTAPVDSVGYKLIINPFLLKIPEVQFPDYAKNPMISGVVTLTAQLERTPAYYSFDFFKNGKYITAGVSADSIQFFQNEKELRNGQDFELIYEKGTITGVNFKEHTRSETLGITIKITKNDPYKPLKQGGIPLQIRPAPDLKSPWRYRINLATQQDFKTDTLRTYMPANFLGKEPLVIINGQEYPSSILHKINPKSFGWSYLATPNEAHALEKYGEKARDGVLEVRTTDDFLFKPEKENQLALENIKREMDARRIYKNDKIVRVRLLDDEGNEFERVIIKGFFEDKNISVDIPINGKIHYEIDGRTVSESDVINYNGLFQGSGIRYGKIPDKNGYHANISLKTKR